MSSHYGERGPSTGARPGALLAVRVTPADVGRRITLRHRVEPEHPGDGRFSDVVGVLRSWSGEGLLELVRRDGEVRVVRADDVVAAKVVAPELSADAMQRVAQAGWPPFETAALGEWELRASLGVTGRANSVRVEGDPGMPLDDALAAVTAWYAERGITPSLQVPTPSRWEGPLDRRGWALARRTLMRTADTAAVLDACGAAAAAAAAPSDAVRASFATEPSAEFLALVEPELPAGTISRILCGPPERVFVELRDDDGLVAVGRASAAGSSAGRWAGVTSIAVAERARRRGLGTRLMAELAGWARDAGCPRIYLQVLATNVPALALYDGLGFVTHHAYEYRTTGPYSRR